MSCSDVAIDFWVGPYDADCNLKQLRAQGRGPSPAADTVRLEGVRVRQQPVHSTIPDGFRRTQNAVVKSPAGVQFPHYEP